MKITKDNYSAIKRHAEMHTTTATAKEFNICAASVRLVRKSKDFNDLRYIQKTQRRQSYEIRKKELGNHTGALRFTPPTKPIDGTGKKQGGVTAAGDPFGEETKPKPIVPQGGQRAPEQDGKVTVVKTGNEPIAFPMTLDDYRREYKRLSTENGTLRGEVAVAKMESKQRQEDYSQIMTQYKELQKLFVELKKHKDKLALELVKIKNEPVTKGTSPTEIEITVGDATIKIATKGETNVNV